MTQSKLLLPPAIQRRRLLLLALGTAGVGVAGSVATNRAVAAATVDPAAARITDFYAALLESMKSAQQLSIKTRYDKLEPAVRAAFDLAAMTRIAVGPAWTSAKPDQQQALLKQFARMTIATYANRFDGYAGERFVVEPEAEPARGDNRLVRSRLLQTQGDPVVLNYLTHETGEGWKAFDVYLNGTISELATRRSEFGALLRNGGAEAVIESLRQRADKLLAG